ncbi:DUF309 domain-containing protein [Nitrososphaera sp.]|uniref:DUF309 domain-containing protein n=1 Tax=Nitrososphaera sp. TaxID=1971748 RepID=UPI002ED96C3B
MQRYFIHLQNRVYTPKDATMLLERARELAKDVVVRDSRVSKKYIEFDTSIPDSMDVGDLVGRLEKISPLASVEHIVEKDVPKDEAVRHAVELFNEEKYWGAHEALEAVWKSTPRGKERDMINGIILVAAAFVHDLKDEREICLSILGRAMKKLDGAGGAYHGINVDRLAARVSKILRTGRIERFTI